MVRPLGTYSTVRKGTKRKENEIVETTVTVDQIVFKIIGFMFQTFLAIV